MAYIWQVIKLSRIFCLLAIIVLIVGVVVHLALAQPVRTYVWIAQGCIIVAALCRLYDFIFGRKKPVKP